MLKGISIACGPREVTLANMQQYQGAVFELTGSRYFGGATADSDTDFFCQWSQPTKDYLVGIGFMQISGETYCDSEIVSVMRHKSAMIDVQLVRDATLKAKVQQYLARQWNYRTLLLSLPKPMRQTVWDLAYSVVNNAKTESQHLVNDINAPVHQLVWKPR